MKPHYDTDLKNFRTYKVGLTSSTHHLVHNKIDQQTHQLKDLRGSQPRTTVPLSELVCNQSPPLDCSKLRPITFSMKKESTCRHSSNLTQQSESPSPKKSHPLKKFTGDSGKEKAFFEQLKTGYPRFSYLKKQKAPSQQSNYQEGRNLWTHRSASQTDHYDHDGSILFRSEPQFNLGRRSEKLRKSHLMLHSCDLIQIGTPGKRSALSFAKRTGREDELVYNQTERLKLIRTHNMAVQEIKHSQNTPGKHFRDYSFMEDFADFKREILSRI